MPKPVINEVKTMTLAGWAQTIQHSKQDAFVTAQQIALRLGAHVEQSAAEFGFWAPEVVGAKEVWLELFIPPAEFNAATITAAECTFDYYKLPVVTNDVYVWCVVENIKIGDKNSFGAFYQLSVIDASGKQHTVRDHLAYSVPFGAMAPAELVDARAMFAARKDASHFASLQTENDPDGTPRITPPLNILQIHVPTATAEGTLSGLTNFYRRLSEKLAKGETPSPAEEAYLGYDAVQLMPIEPTIVHEAGPDFWEVQAITDDKATIKLLKPDITNWGYDIMMSASSTTNPVILGSKRPHELLEFIETMHAFHGKPIKVIFDIVYGHTDNQAVNVLNTDFLAGPGMYGQNMRFRHPVTRAVMLEMQRRKSLYGVDGIRVDGAQDFKYWDEAAQELKYDDEYLHLMNDIVLEVAGTRYRPYMIFEDGRPWPRDDWELASSYREVTKQLPNVFQWGPLTFAHNTPFLFTFWLTKWWRIREITQVGSKWITGCANHDTLRRGTQVPTDARINTYLGKTLPEILKNAYDNPAAKLFDYALMPGVPMDFINASLRSPWSFIRNTDDRYGVKVMSEEARFAHWAMDEVSFNAEVHFKRLKAMNFKTLTGIRQFIGALDNAVKLTHYDLDKMVTVLQSLGLEGPKLSVHVLKEIARAWMDDVHDYCNISHHLQHVDGIQTGFQRKTRAFRFARTWLREDFGDKDTLSYRHPSDGTILFYGLRHSPDGREQVLFIANMEGAPCEVKPLSLDLPHLADGDWQLALSTPKLKTVKAQQPFILKDSEGVVFVRKL
jgi:hypothetical protein